MKTLFDKSVPGRSAFHFPPCEFPSAEKNLPAGLLRVKEADLPDLAEVDVIRHYANLARRNFGVDIGFYPLGSCTMKFNPKVNEDIAVLPSFQNIHPLQDDDASQGALELFWKLQQSLLEICGMDSVSLQPFAGAHGEFTALKLFKAYFKDSGQENRNIMIVPDSSHGTNPASAHLAGFEVVEVASDFRGMVSVESLKPHLNKNLAGIMLTNPNTLGIFEQDILEIADAVHTAGGLLYYDGANLNAIVGKVRPGDMGFDAVHINLHKSFSTPHGGGGPGSGPVLVKEKLTPYLPVPLVDHINDSYVLNFSLPKTIGRVAGFWGNFGVIVRAFAYILSMGSDGLSKVAEIAVLNANYLKEKLKGSLLLPYDTVCKHEFVLSAKELKDKTGITALDIAKGLIDNNIHPPTIYFPLIVPEALMIEPTETESLETLDNFVEVMQKIVKTAVEAPDLLHSAPNNTEISRVDETLAARKPVVRYIKE